MTLASGTRLGSYEITAPLGAGGMGEVWRARDLKLGRDVAIKVLQESFASQPDALARFEREARAIAAVSHPNILAIFDFAIEEGVSYAVMELLDGESLREKLAAGPIPPRKALDYALQIARGLAAGHEKGIVHRDIKPENLFVLRDGRVKILDFGLAKSTTGASGKEETSAPTMTRHTEPGAVLGTVGYMSPEQVRGLVVDARTDIFSYGAVLYEMLSGKRAFTRSTASDTLAAILRDEPEPLPSTDHGVSSALDRVVRRCLQKDPEERFRSVSDLAFAIELASDAGTGGAMPAPGATAPRLPSFQQLTFRRGTIWNARFAPDGRTIVYSAAWDGNAIELFSTRTESPESRALGLAGSELLAVSAAGEMAVLLDRRPIELFIPRGTLGRVPLAGGAPREILEDVQFADFSADGRSFAVVRELNGRRHVQFPIGKTLYETSGWVSHLRIAPGEDRLAFVDHPVRGDNHGTVTVLELDGTKRSLTPELKGVLGLAWWPSGREVWYTATEGGPFALHAVTLSGRTRPVWRTAGSVTLLDISPDGRVLVTRDGWRWGVVGIPPRATDERDLSWFDLSVAAGLSTDGTKLLIAEYGGGRPVFATYLRKTDGSAAVHLGEGEAVALSPDGRWALALLYSTPPALLRLPTGAGEARSFERGSIGAYHWATWFPDGARILICANEPERGRRLWVQGTTGGPPEPITPEGVSVFWEAVSPDGAWIAALGADETIALYPATPGEPRRVPGLERGDLPIRWSADGRFLYAFRFGELPARIQRVDVASGERTLWREIMPSDPAGVEEIRRIYITPDESSYFYTYYRFLSELYLAEGLA